jgi:hypothetical protein
MPFFGVQQGLLGSGSTVEILCCVRVHESASPRHSLVVKHVWSPFCKVKFILQASFLLLWPFIKVEKVATRAHTNGRDL